MTKNSIYFGSFDELDKMLNILDSYNVDYEIYHANVDLDEENNIKDTDGTIIIKSSLKKASRALKDIEAMRS